MNITVHHRWFTPFITAVPLLFSSITLNAQDIEEILVTGSLIRGTPEDAALPVTTFSRDDLSLQGLPTTQELIRNLSFSQGNDGAADQNVPNAGLDRATVNIRGLGPSRSLVLVNGRRTTWSPGAIGDQAQLLVDVNMMPSMALQRIELLRDGAAATYGSDAIAGVMNFITRGDFDGFEVTASHKTIQESDGDSEFGAIWGSDFMDGRGHFMTSASYINRSRLRIADRDWSLTTFDENTRGGWSSFGRPSVFVPYAEWFSERGQGVLQNESGWDALHATGIADPRCEFLGGARTGIREDNPNGGICRFQYNAFINLAEDAERWQWWTEASFELNDTTSLNVEFLLTDSEVPRWETSPSYPPNRLINENRTILANNPGLIDMARLHPDLYGDYAACDEAYCRYTGDGGAQDAAGRPAEWQESGWIFGRTFGQDGPSQKFSIESEMMRFAATLDGEINDMNWQLAATYSEADRTVIDGDTAVYREARARYGLGGHACEAAVPNEYNDQGELEFSLETLQANAGQGNCRYWIPFSVSMHGADPAVLNANGANPDFNPALDNRLVSDYILFSAETLIGNTSLFTLDGVLTGEMAGVDLGAGSLAYAAGFQYRDESYSRRAAALYDANRFPCAAGPEITDCETGRTGLFGFLPPRFPIEASRDIWSVFAEAQLPLTGSLDAQFSIRHESYGGLTGSTTDPKVALKWQVNDSVSVRGSYGTTFRGPTLNQTVSNNSSNSLQYVDPTGAFKRIDTSGNPNLKPEEATTFNVGLLVDRDGLFTDSDDFFMTLDYWSYDFQDPIVTEPFATMVSITCPPPSNACNENATYFDRLVFGSSSTNATDLEIINVNIINGPDYHTDGIDFSFHYGLNAGPGYLSWDLTGTKIQSFDIDSWVFNPESYDALGRLNYRTSLARTLAEWKGQTSLNYAFDNWNLRWMINAVGEYKYAGASPQTCGNDCIVPSHVTHDLHINWSLLDDQLIISASAINLEDEDPPYMSREFNYDHFTHNPFGRMLRLGLTYSLQ